MRSVISIDRELIVKGTKTHAMRTVRLDAETAAMLRSHRKEVTELGLAAGAPLEEHDFVFARGARIRRTTPARPDQSGVDSPSQEEGVDTRLHDLRHLQASLLLDAGEAVTTVAAPGLGHKDTATTLKIYGHLMPGANERAASLVGEALSLRQSSERSLPGGRRRK